MNIDKPVLYGSFFMCAVVFFIFGLAFSQYQDAHSFKGYLPKG